MDLLGEAPVVIDPVMVAESGATLLDHAARAALRERLVPRAAVVTPNLAEARVLAELGRMRHPRSSRGPCMRWGRRPRS